MQRLGTYRTQLLRAVRHRQEKSVADVAQQEKPSLRLA